jgi:hypothetical protein
MDSVIIRGWKFKNIAGQTFGKVKAVRVVGKTDRGAALWECLCECGRACEFSRERMQAGAFLLCEPCRRKAADDRFREHFWGRVSKSGLFHPVCGQCWEWTGARFRYGYGAQGWKGKNHKAHRIAWELVNGPIPDGMCICHHCDNPPCCNPAHLFLGTMQDNMDDKHAKGRQWYPRPFDPVKGERCHTSKLNEEQVREIRRVYRKWSKTHGTYALAEKYGVSQGNIHSIVTGETWKHLLLSGPSA